MCKQAYNQAPSSVTRFGNKMWPTVLKSCPKCCHTSFTLKGYVPPNSPKSDRISGLLLWRNLWPRTLKIAQSGHTTANANAPRAFSLPGPRCKPAWNMLNLHSVTRLGDLLHFGQLFKACGSNYFDQIAHILGTFWRSQYLWFFVKSFLGIFIDIWRFISGHVEPVTH